MKRLILLLALLLAGGLVLGQEPIDPAFDPPYVAPSSGRGIRWNGTLGVVIINGKVYQQFGLRPDIPFGKWGVGLDLTFRFDEDGEFKEDEWDDGIDYVEKIYYIRYGLPGDPLYVRIGALDKVTLGYGIVMKHYANTIQYPEIKRIGLYTEGRINQVGWQAMFNNFRELDEPGLMAARLSFDTGLKGLTIGGTIAHDGNQFAGLRDEDNDGVPDRIDLFPGENDGYIRERIESLYIPDEIDSLIQWGLLPDIRQNPQDYSGLKESVTIVGADIGLPLIKGRPVSLWTYAQMAKIIDFGWGWAFPGARMVVGPLEVGAEYRHYEKEFFGEFFNYPYEIERVQLVEDTFATKESTLAGLGEANGYYADVLMSFANFGYIYSWYLDMHGPDYPAGRTIFGEAGVTPPGISRLQKVAGYYMQPNVKRLFEAETEGTIYGAKFFFAMAQNVSLVYDHRVTIANGERQRTIRIETMVTF